MDRRVVPNNVLLEDVASLLDEGREVVLAPKGNSMLPFIREGRDSVALRKLGDVETGDIVLVRLAGRYVMHRVVAIDGERLTLMGDGNVGLKEHCTVADVIGTVVWIVRGNKKFKPGKGRLWRALCPLRRVLLALYRRLI
ncbi:MAG: S24/S26 family peptidase [Bacteroidales bacterium]|nr:S24/S26 family peptidase [Bacteroidales bacterium]